MTLLVSPVSETNHRCGVGLCRVGKHPGILLSLIRQSVSSHMEQGLQSGQASVPREAVAHLLLVMVTLCFLTAKSALMLLTHLQASSLICLRHIATESSIRACHVDGLKHSNMHADYLPLGLEAGPAKISYNYYYLL